MPKYSSDENLTAKILEKSGGNPFFLEEIIKDIKERETENEGILHYIDGFSLPDSVFSVLFSRLDRLDPQKKKILQASSVIGAKFTESLLSEIVYQDNSRISEQLDALAEQQYIVKQNGSYSFKHPLILETSYKTIVKKDKKLLHVKTAQALEKITGEKPKNFHEDLSFHYLKSEVWEKAYEHSMISAKKAAENYQNELSLKFYENAAVSAERLNDKKKKISAMLGKSKILGFIGRTAEALETTKLILKQSKEIKDDPLTAEIRLFLSGLYAVFSDYKNMLRHSVPLLEYFKINNKYLSYADCLFTVGKAYFFTGDYKKSLRYLEESYLTFDRIGNKTGILKSLNSIGLNYFELSDYKNSLLFQNRALRISKKCSSRVDRSYILTSLAFVHFKLCRYKKAERYYKESMKIKKETGHLQGYAHNIAHLGILYYITNDYGKALEHFEKSLSILKEIKENRSIANIQYYIACIQYRRGRLDEAHSILKKYAPMSKNIGDMQGYSACILILAQLFAQIGEYEKAQEYFSENLKVNKINGDRAESARNLIFTAKMQIEKGELNKALKNQSRAIELTADLDLPDIMFMYFYGLSSIELMKKRHGPALKYLKKAQKYENRINTRSCQALVLQLKGRIYGDMKDCENAKKSFTRSERIFRKIGASLDLAETLYHHGVFLKKTGEKDIKTEQAFNVIKDIKLSKFFERKALDNLLNKSLCSGSE